MVAGVFDEIPPVVVECVNVYESPWTSTNLFRSASISSSYRCFCKEKLPWRSDMVFFMRANSKDWISTTKKRTLGTKNVK